MAYIYKNGVAIPRDVRQVGIFKGLQRAINAVLDMSYRAPDMYSEEARDWPVSEKLGMYISQVDVDGQIGPKTSGSLLDLVGNTGLKNKWYGSVIPVSTFDPVTKADTTDRRAQTMAIADHAEELAADLMAIISRKLDTAASPLWLTAVSPVASYA